MTVNLYHWIWILWKGYSSIS